MDAAEHFDWAVGRAMEYVEMEPSYAWTEGGAWAKAVLAALHVEVPR